LHHPGFAMTLRLRHPNPPREEWMGRIVTSVAIANAADPACSLRCDALVDTGAYCLTLPASWKERLGTLPMSRQVAIELADRTMTRGEVCGPVRIQITGFDPIAGEVLFLDDDGGARAIEPLVGYITLEQSGAAVDMLGHRLLRLPALDLKRASAA
jgi:predicted aspartyl protease